MIVGKIIKVKGIRVIAELYEEYPQYLVESNSVQPSPQINTFVKTKVGFDTVVCQIVGEYIDEVYYGNNYKKKYCVELDIKGHLKNNKFYSGLRVLPFINAKVLTLTNEDYKVLYTVDDHFISIGRNIFDESKRVQIPINKLIPSHIGIFGNTGSGKSNTLAKIVREYCFDIFKNKNAKKKAHIVLFDLNNEYGSDSIVENTNKKVIKLYTGKRNNREYDKIKIDYTKLDVEDWKILLSATERTQLPIIKKVLQKLKEELNPEEKTKNYEDILRSLLVNRNATIFNQIRMQLSSYINGIDNITFNSTQSQFYYKYNDGRKEYINTLNDIKQISFNIDFSSNYLNQFEFELLMETAKEINNGLNYEYVSPLLRRFNIRVKEFEKVFEEGEFNTYFDWFENKNLLVVQLGQVNKEMQEVISSLLIKIIFSEKCDRRDKDKTDSIVSVVIDEAHNLLSYNDSSDENSIHGSSLATYEKVIKEGRKFGVYMYIASQRPHDISQTITSQLHNYFIHRLVNPNDIQRIRTAVSYMSEEHLNMVTVLGPGECIVSGTATAMPEYVSVDELSENDKPNSNDIVLYGKDGIFET